MKRTNPVRVMVLAAFILVISLLHYLTPLHLPMLHDIFQRLYYLPIILAAFWFGLRGGLIASIVVSIMYVPHIVFQWGMHPSLELEKFLEILLYNVVGGGYRASLPAGGTAQGGAAQDCERARGVVQETAEPGRSHYSD